MTQPARRGVVVRGLAFATVTLISVLSTSLPRAESPGPTLDDRWQQVRQLRAAGQFDDALDTVDAIFSDFADSNQVLQQAFCHRVFIHQARGDTAQARMAAREALARYPDLEADVTEFPPALNALYGRLRGEMFGTLVIRTPAAGRVSLDGEYRGEIPLRLELVPVGDHELSVIKSGFREHRERVRVAAGREVELTLSMSATRGTKWWLVRAGPVLGAAVLGSIIASAGGGDEGPLEPLPLPPPPPQ